MEGLLSQNYLSKASIFGTSDIIKSIQYVFTGSASTEIDTVDISKTALVYLGQTVPGSSGDIDAQFKRAYLQDSTHIALDYRALGGSISLAVIEFAQVKSRQEGTITAGIAGATVNIQPVDLDKSFLFFSGWKSVPPWASAAAWVAGNPYLKFNSSSEIVAMISDNNNGHTSVLGYTVIELP